MVLRCSSNPAIKMPMGIGRMVHEKQELEVDPGAKNFTPFA
jgi:hypothetical protein